MIIDAHQHFWQPARGDYGWLTPSLTALYRDFMPLDLAPLLDQNGVSGTILVQAAPTVAETQFMLRIADETPFVFGVVGWVDFADPAAPHTIAALAAHPKLVGLRPMIQDIACDDWMLRDDLTPAFEAMIEHGLVFDALVLPRHLPRLARLLERHPTLKVVIDHAAKPEIAARQFDAWARDMAVLARLPHVFCKLSGLLTEAGESWSVSDLDPYVDHLFAIFGSERLIWGSDWPVLTLAASYDRWMQIAQSCVAETAARVDIFGQNAVRAYGLKPVPAPA
ncbi:amidohydrolase family protein (plasmid) [Rhodobacteraceae bacterium SC52]|nr:amidohydrolase family protein [Rhodobacteraceae bacterium SC52]